MNNFDSEKQRRGYFGHGYPHFANPPKTNNEKKIIPQGRGRTLTPKERVKIMARNSPFPFNEREMERKLMAQDKAKEEFDSHNPEHTRKALENAFGRSYGLRQR